MTPYGIDFSFLSLGQCMFCQYWLTTCVFSIPVACLRHTHSQRLPSPVFVLKAWCAAKRDCCTSVFGSIPASTADGVMSPDSISCSCFPIMCKGDALYVGYQTKARRSFLVLIDTFLCASVQLLSYSLIHSINCLHHLPTRPAYPFTCRYSRLIQGLVGPLDVAQEQVH